MSTAEIYRGETLTFALRHPDAALVTATTVAAAIRRASGRSGLAETDPPGLAFAVTPVSPAGEADGGWDIMLPVDRSLQLEPGLHFVDALFTTGQQVKPLRICSVLVRIAALEPGGEA